MPHTIHPWTYRRTETDGVPYDFCVQRGTEVLATVHDLGSDRLDEAEANARLIAAAPEMLEAITPLMRDLEVLGFGTDKPISGAEVVDCINNHYPELRRAITKAMN